MIRVPFALVLSAGLLLTATSVMPQERAPGVRRLAFEIEVDCLKARAVGWNPSASGDAPVVQLAARLVQRRFEALERPAVVELESGTNRFRVSLPSIDARDRELVGGLLRSMGLSELLFPCDLDEVREAERKKLDAWRAQHADEPLDAFNGLTPEEDGPRRGFFWVPVRGTGEGLFHLPVSAADALGAGAFERVTLATSASGLPAVSIHVQRKRVEDLERVTKANIGHLLAITMLGQVVAAPEVQGKLSNPFLVEGRFEEAETKRWVELLEAGQGPLRVSEKR